LQNVYRISRTHLVLWIRDAVAIDHNATGLNQRLVAVAAGKEGLAQE
jgi:hypothetical protein